MNRRDFLHGTMAAPALMAAAPEKAAAATDEPTAAPPLLANDPVIVYESPDPKGVYAGSPGLAILPTGRLIATMDQRGKGLKDLPDLEKGPEGRYYSGNIYSSDDHGKTWTHRACMPFSHARPFFAGKSVYIIGHCGDLGVMRSDDNGETWTRPAWLTEGQRWHQAPCNVHYTRGRVYLVMERNTDPSFKGWAVSVLAPVLMSGDVTADLTKRESWTFSNELSFKAAVEHMGKPHGIGCPFYSLGRTDPLSKGDTRPMHPMGWLETNVVQFTDPDHVWHDPDGRTFHLWMRAHTGSTGLAAIAKAVEAEDGSLTVSVEQAPSGEPMLFVPCPGGQMKFHILYDESTKLFWLLSTQATDSMTRPNRLPDNRFNLPNNERHRLVLHFSKNCVDWCFACRVADTGDNIQSRHYASMVIDGDDLHILSRSGDERAKSAHDGNLVTFHTVRGFRKLVY